VTNFAPKSDELVKLSVVLAQGEQHDDAAADSAGNDHL
jgi:hypothetical protein